MGIGIANSSTVKLQFVDEKLDETFFGDVWDRQSPKPEQNLFPITNVAQGDFTQNMWVHHGMFAEQHLIQMRLSYVNVVDPY